MKITIEVTEWFPATPPYDHNVTHRMGNPTRFNPFLRHCLERGCNYSERRETAGKGYVGP